MKRNRSGLSGFTLIELLVVIAIIGLLLAVIAPSLRMAKEKARGIVCTSQVRTFGVGFQIYAVNNHDKLPTFNSYGYWLESIAAYYDNVEDARLCPSAKKPQEGTWTTTTRWGGPHYAWQAGFGSYAGINSEGEIGSYCHNMWASASVKAGTVDNLVGFTVGDKKESLWGSATAKGAGQTPLVADGSWWGSAVGDSYAGTDGAGLDSLASMQSDQTLFYSEASPTTYSGPPTPYGISRYIINRHNKEINTVFLDGSARRVPVEGLWELSWHKTYQAHPGPEIVWAR